MEYLKLLREFVLFSKLGEQELEKIASKVTEKTYGDGEFICRQGEKGGNLFLIKHGTVMITLPLDRYRDNNKYDVIASLGKGMYFGELSFFDGKQYSSDVYAKGEVILLVLNRADFDDIIAADLKKGYDIQNKIILNLVHIIREMNKKYSLNALLR